MIKFEEIAKKMESLRADVLELGGFHASINRYTGTYAGAMEIHIPAERFTEMFKDDEIEKMPCLKGNHYEQVVKCGVRYFAIFDGEIEDDKTEN